MNKADILPHHLRRTGERIPRLRKDLSRDFSMETLVHDKAWRLFLNTHPEYLERMRRRIRRKL